MLESSLLIYKQRIKDKDVSFLALTLSMFLLPYSINLSSLVFLLSIGAKLQQIIFKKDELFINRSLKNVAVIGIVFFVYIILVSCIQAGLEETLLNFNSEFSKFSLFFLTPLLVRNNRDNVLIFKTFSLGVIGSVVFALFYSLFNNISFDRYVFASIYDLHHTYLSMFLLLIVNFYLYHLVNSKEKLNRSEKWIATIVILGSFMTIYRINSKVSMVIIVLLFILHLLPKFSLKRSFKYLIGVIAVFIVFLFFLKKINVNYEHALGFRMQIWEAAAKVFKGNMVFGSLEYPEKTTLNYQHYLDGKYYFLDCDLNCHNQYLSILMRFGIVGFLIFSMFAFNIFKHLKLNIKNPRIREFIGFLIIISSVFFIEDILSRHHGILFFTCFYNYYLLIIKNE